MQTKKKKNSARFYAADMRANVKYANEYAVRRVLCHGLFACVGYGGHFFFVRVVCRSAHAGGPGRKVSQWVFLAQRSRLPNRILLRLHGCSRRRKEKSSGRRAASHVAAVAVVIAVIAVIWASVSCNLIWALAGCKHHRAHQRR